MTRERNHSGHYPSASFEEWNAACNGRVHATAARSRVQGRPLGTGGDCHHVATAVGGQTRGLTRRTAAATSHAPHSIPSRTVGASRSSARFGGNAGSFRVRRVDGYPVRASSGATESTTGPAFRPRRVGGQLCRGPASAGPHATSTPRSARSTRFDDPRSPRLRGDARRLPRRVARRPRQVSFCADRNATHCQVASAVMNTARPNRR